jgi:poly-gamma-glutamate synthesis protein (capsule biosynthesis protein)
MKKLLLNLLCIIICVLLIGCTNSEQKSKNTTPITNDIKPIKSDIKNTVEDNTIKNIEKQSIVNETNNLVLITYSDITNNSTKESLMLDISKLEDNKVVTLKIIDENNSLIWKEDAGLPHVGWNSIYLCSLDNKNYLFRYNPYMNQGYADYKYELFNLNQDGTLHLVNSKSLSFDLSSSKKEIDVDEIISFVDEVNKYLTQSILLLSTEGGTLKYSTDNNLLQNTEKLSFLDDFDIKYDKNATLKEKLEIYSKTLTTKNSINNDSTSTTITLTAIGDCTIGSFPEVTKGKSFEDVLEQNKNDYEYPFKNAFKWIKSDDITLINFEGTLTDANIMANKKWRFKGPKEYTNFLTSSSVEVVNLANNHSYDYLEKGYKDTVDNMNNAGIGVSGNEYVLIKEVKGIKIAFIGHLVNNEPKDIFDKIKKTIDEVKEQGVNLVVCSFHWGIEYNYNPTKYQKKLGRFAIDAGADMVIGHHPHIIQGIELYKDRYIAYSLGNFVFGGNEILYDKKHTDTDTILLSQKIEFNNNEISNIKLSVVPFKLSGDPKYNNYQPVVQSEEESLQIKDKLIKLSKKLKYGINTLEISK